MKVVAVINDGAVIKKILDYLSLWEGYTAEGTMANARASPVREDPAENNYVEYEPFKPAPAKAGDGWVQAIPTCVGTGLKMPAWR
jgi:hypothetical protein